MAERDAENGDSDPTCSKAKEGAAITPGGVLEEPNCVWSDESADVPDGIDQRDSDGGPLAAQDHGRQAPERREHHVGAEDDETERSDAEDWLRKKRRSGESNGYEDTAHRGVIKTLVFAVGATNYSMGCVNKYTPAGNRIWQDVINLPPNGSVRIRSQFRRCWLRVHRGRRDRRDPQLRAERAG